MRAPLRLTVLAALLLAGCGRAPDVILSGERLPLRESGGTLVAAPRGLALSAPQANADWTHRNGGPDHALGHPALGGALQSLFSVQIGEGNSRGARITAEPVVAGGRIFTLDARATVQAFSTGGEVLWSQSVVPPDAVRPDASGGGLATDGVKI